MTTPHSRRSLEEQDVKNNIIVIDMTELNEKAYNPSVKDMLNFKRMDC